jgi:hypothetical protein
MDLSSGYTDHVWLFLKMKLKSFNIAFIFDLDYRYIVLSRGMHHNESWKCLSAQVTHVSCERHKSPYVHGFGFDSESNPVTPGLGTRWHQVLCQPAQRLVVWNLSGTEFGNSVAPGLSEFVTDSIWGVRYLYPHGPNRRKLLFLRLLVCFLVRNRMLVSLRGGGGELGN